ncbi:MAG TPA: hypothetical protein ENJ05_10695 [Thiotrichales bacterium]|nr:hypothetical protein [Thiotrichales bacterium]
MKRLISHLLIIALAFGAQSAMAASNYVQEIKALYESGRVREAYALANRHLLEAEGDPAFDYYYGLAAIDSGFVSQGVFALERVLLLRPDNDLVRLELARGYFLLEQYDRARREFNKVLAAGPPQEVQANIRSFLDIIRLRESDYKTTAGLYLELGTGYDTNVNSGPSGANFDSPLLGPGTLDNASVAMEDAYLNYAAGVNVSHPVRPGLALTGNLSYSHREHEEATEFDIGSFNAQGGVSWVRGDDRYQAGLQWQNYEVGHDRYRELLGLNGEWRRHLDDHTLVSAFVQLADMDFYTNRMRDSWQGMAGLGLQLAFGGALRPLVFGTLYGGKERARNDDSAARSLVDRDIYGASLGGQVMLHPAFSLDIGVQWQESRYRNDDGFFLLKREDEFKNVSLGATWLPYRHWSLRTKLGYTDNSANISINRYHRTELGVTLRYEY